MGKRAQDQPDSRHVPRVGRRQGATVLHDMRHLDKAVVRHLQHVLMPGDKATYMDYCEQKNIDFTRDLLELRSENSAFSGGLLIREDFQTNVEGLYNGCVFPSFSGAICGGPLCRPAGS